MSGDVRGHSIQSSISDSFCSHSGNNSPSLLHHPIDYLISKHSPTLVECSHPSTGFSSAKSESANSMSRPTASSAISVPLDMNSRPSFLECCNTFRLSIMEKTMLFSSPWQNSAPNSTKASPNCTLFMRPPAKNWNEEMNEFSGTKFQHWSFGCKVRHKSSQDLRPAFARFSGTAWIRTRIFSSLESEINGTFKRWNINLWPLLSKSDDLYQCFGFVVVFFNLKITLNMTLLFPIFFQDHLSHIVRFDTIV